jgi:hypothetical protein
MNDTSNTDNTTTTGNKLQDFVTAAGARGQITFGDVRRLERDYLPGGITTNDEAELLIGLDRVVIRADRAWKGWLTAAIRDFNARCDRASDAGAREPCERLKALRAAKPSGKAVRNIDPQIPREAERPAAPVRQAEAPQPILFPIYRDLAPLALRVHVPLQAVRPVGVWGGMNRLAMAA